MDTKNLILSDSASIVVAKKYLKKDEYGKLCETPIEWLTRVSLSLSKAEENEKDRKKWGKIFFEIFERMEFLPGGRTLANSGTSNGQLANCFVLPFEDNIEEIFESVRDGAILKKNGGGVGFSFARIRPKGDYISGTSGAACGPVALMKVLDSSSEILLQDGGRRSGNMVVLPVSHPDIFDFITSKEKETSLNQINFSIGVTSKFMDAVIKNKNWDLINPRTGRVVQTVSAKSIFELAANYAWKSGDPGLIFLDRINKDNPTPQMGPLEAVNLCGEQPLLPYEACNLGSINLAKFKVENIKKEASINEQINWKRLEFVTRVAVRLLDNVISVCKYPLSKVDRVVKANRKIGLGVMGWGDLLIDLSIPYNSDEAVKLGAKIMKFIWEVGHDESKKLGKEKGSFPSFEGSKWKIKGYRSMRNATVTTIAPTGSISMVASCSSGIEPLFALSYYKEVFGGMKFPEINPVLMRKLKDYNVKNKNFNFEIAKKVIIERGSVSELKEIHNEIKKVFVTAMDIDPIWHIKMQAAFQKYTDNAVSKTINLKNNITTKEVEKSFILAWKLGCKGITVYRDKSREKQVLNVGSREKQLNKKLEKSELCPSCGQKLHIEEGCKKCPSCGFSACSL